MRLGRHLALSLAEQGYDIALHYNQSAERAAATCKEIRALGRDCRLYQADLASLQSEHTGDDVGGIEVELLRRVVADFPDLTTLVNNASVYEPGTLADLDSVLLRRQLRVNTEAPILLTQAFARAAGRGQVVNIIDNKIAFAQYHYTAYLLSKKMLAEFTKLAALELAPNIRVNGIAPGVVLPAQSRNDAYLQWRVEGIPVRRQGTPEEIASALRFLCENQFVTGQILFVDGGESLGSPGRSAPAFGGGAS